MLWKILYMYLVSTLTHYCRLYERDPQNKNLFIKKIVHLFLHVYTSVTFKMLSIWWNTPIQMFFPMVKNSFCTQFCCLLVPLPFLFHIFHNCKMFPFEDFFSFRETKKVSPDEVGWIGRVGHRSHTIFAQKLLNTQWGVGRCACKSPIMKWAKAMSLQKNSLKLNAASHNNTSSYTDSAGFLEHLPSWESLYYQGPTFQKILPFLGGGTPSYT